MGRRIKRGARGDGVLREIRVEMYVIGHLFDVSDSRLLPGGRTPELWRIDENTGWQLCAFFRRKRGMMRNMRFLGTVSNVCF